MEDSLLNRPAFMLIVIAATVLMVTVTVKAVSDYLGRRYLIAKGTPPEELGSEISKITKWHLIKNLKWALICIGFGAAVILTDRFPGLVSTTGGFGFMFVGAGLGYLLYFLVAWHWLKKDDATKRQDGDNG